MLSAECGKIQLPESCTVRWHPLYMTTGTVGPVESCQRAPSVRESGLGSGVSGDREAFHRLRRTIDLLFRMW